MNIEDPSSKGIMETNGGPAVTLTIRLIMQGKEVGSIIGKKGDNIKKFREESGAKINISDGSCPERIVTVTGPTEAILKAFALISNKFEEDIYSPAAMDGLSGPNSVANSTGGGGSGGKPQVTLRLVVPASQCGSLIGKGGSKIKEIREITGATIQVASEMLPNSTERAVTISGNSDAITKCIYQICCVMMESPPKGATIPYRPKPAMPPVIFAGGQAYTIQGQYAIPHPDLTKLHQLALQHNPLIPGQNNAQSLAAVAQQHQQQQPTQPQPHSVATHPASTHHAAAAAAAAAYHAAGLSPQAAALANLAATTPLGGRPAGPAGPPAVQAGAASTAEMRIPNELIGCIIGKGGAKINEIRQLSGASIKISNTEEGSKDRMVAIAGTPESINLAQYLINTSTGWRWDHQHQHQTGLL